MTKRKCYKCKIEKSLENFYKDKTQSLGKSWLCKKCANKKRKEYEKTFPEKRNATQRNWWDKNPKRKLFHNAKKRAKEKNLEFTIKIEDIFIPTFCPVLGLKLEHGLVNFSDNSPSLDRLDNKKGYTKENIRVISFRANTLKSDASLEEMEKLLTWYRKETSYETRTRGKSLRRIWEQSIRENPI